MRNLSDVVREGQEKEAIVADLLKKQMAGTITSEESNRLGMLTGNLLALRDEAIGIMGGVPEGRVGIPYSDSDEDYDPHGDEMDEYDDWDDEEGNDEEGNGLLW